MKTNSLLINLFFIFHFSFFVSSCLIDKDEIYMETENAGKEILLKVQVSGHSAPESRAFSAAGENSIQTLDVFVFEEKPSGEQFVYYRPATHIEGNTGTTSIRTFSVSLQESEESGKVRFVLVANMRDRIENISFQKGEDKETVLKKITFDAGDAWDTSTPRYLPMWGESKDSYRVTPSLSSTHIGTISLFRSVARLDIGVNMTGADDAPRGLQNGRFLIQEVKIHNASDRGYIAPDYANFDPAGGEEGKGIVTVPTIPSDASSVILSYNHNIEITPYGFHREIYLAETEASAGHTILIGAYYIPPGESLSTVDKTWYRVNLYEPLEYDDDFEIDPEKPDEKPPLPERTLWDILRNYRYRVNITQVDRAGYNSEEEALENDPANLLTDISVYDESGDINYVIYDENYMLGLEKNNYIFTLDEHTNVSFPILTNYESGWSYEITDSAGEDGNPVSWITNDSRTTNPAGIKDYLTITIEAGVISRSACIHVKAGVLKEVITIIQQ